VIYNWKNIVKNSIPLLTICIIIEIFAGQILQLNQGKLLTIPIFLISIPVINGIGGNLGSILGARMASGLHVGYIDYNVKDKNMHQNLITTIVLGIITYFSLAIIIYLIAMFWGIAEDIELIEFTAIMFGAGLLLILVISIISIITAFWSFKKGLDPDDMVAPVVTTVGDTMGIIFLFLSVGVVGI
jgi:mgtE-like transporter